MEEADALATRIGIMAHGKLRCLGTQLHLKNKFGKGYRLNVSLHKDDISPTNIEKIDAFVGSNISPHYSLLEQNRETMRIYQLPKQSTKVSTVFREMQRMAKTLKIQEWSINQTNLDEVFLHIAKKDAHEFTNE